MTQLEKIQLLLINLAIALDRNDIAYDDDKKETWLEMKRQYKKLQKKMDDYILRGET